MLTDTLKTAGIVTAISLAAAIFLQHRVEDNRAETPAPQRTQQKTERPPAVAAAAAAMPSAERGVEILKADSRGHFAAQVELNGVTIRGLVDTGATYVSFSAEDAERAGLRPMPSDFRYRSATANGEIAIAVIKIPELRLGDIVVRDVDAAILPDGALKGTLIGMSFLRRLSRFEVDGDRLVLKQ